MASNKIKGITIEIGGDTTGLDKALRGVNSAIKETQSELKAVDKALKLDPGNTELLEQKQRALAGAVEETKQKLETLKVAQEQAAEQLARGDIGQEQYDALQREIVKTEASLKEATKASEGFNATLEQAKVKLGKVGDAAGAVAEKTRVLSAAAAGLVAGIGTLAIKTAAAADDLNTLSQQTGIATDDLQKMQYASDIVDVSVESMTRALAKMTKQLGSSSGEEKLRALGVATRDASGQLRDSEAIFYDTLAALSRVGNETERDALAMEIFGKGANELAGIIDDGGAALKALGEEAERLGIIMDQETLDSLNEVNDEIDKLKAKAKGDLAKAGAAALEALTPVIEKVIASISSLLDWIGSLDPTAMQIILTIAAVIAAISPVAGMIYKITVAVQGIIAILPVLGGAMSALPFVAIGAAIAALAILIATHWDEIKAVIQAGIAKVKEFAEKVKTFLSAAGESISQTWQAVKDAVVGVWTSITDTVKEKINAIIGMINGLIEKINEATTKINQSGIGRALGVNIGQIGTLSELPLSRSGGGQTNNYNTVNYNTSSQPLQVNVQLDSQAMARALVTPMQGQMRLAGGSSIV